MRTLYLVIFLISLGV